MVKTRITHLRIYKINLEKCMHSVVSTYRNIPREMFPEIKGIFFQPKKKLIDTEGLETIGT